MGVMATFCQLCGLPAQHDHYVRAAREKLPLPAMLKIYRNPSSHSWAPGERPFEFEAHHAWLADAVALMKDDGRVLRGRMQDGAIILAEGGKEEWVGDGHDDGTVYHHVCWEKLGSPGPDRAQPSTYGSYELSFIEPYQRQLFDFHELCDDGRGWMLEDPRTSERTAAYLDTMVDVAKAREVGNSSKRGGLWGGGCVRGKQGARRSIGRTRRYVSDADRAEFPEAVWFDKMVEPKPYVRPELEALERKVKEITERDGRAIFVSAVYNVDRMLLTWYAKDGESSLQEIEALPKLDIVVDSAHGTRVDPAWEFYEGRQVGA
jgi:hypothetical protein